MTQSVPKDLKGFHVFISKDGETAVTKPCSIAEAQNSREALRFYKPDLEGIIHFNLPFSVYKNSPLDEIRLTRVPSVKMWVLARNEEHAIKIAAERRAQILALNRWPTEFDNWGHPILKVEESE